MKLPRRVSTDDAYWKKKAEQAALRKQKLLSFGPHACGILVNSKVGPFVVDPEDGFVAALLMLEGVYNEEELDLARSLVTPEGDVLMVGTHIGAHAVPLSRHCKRLIAIEANPNTFSFLKANLLLNQCTNVAAYNIAAGDKPEKIKFMMNRDNSGGSKRMPTTMDIIYDYDAPKVIEIDAVPLDAMLEIKKFDLILMDIEGSEYFALKGMQQILSQSNALMVEFFPYHLRDVANVTTDEFLAPILPHFNWMYVPKHDCVVPKNEIAARVKAYYDAEEFHDGLVFLKEPLPEKLCGKLR